MSTYDHSVFIVTTIRQSFDAAGRSVAGLRPASILGRVVWATVLGVVLLVAAVVVIPLLLLALVVALAWTAFARLGAFFGSLRRDNGPLDGRRNVRVIRPSDEP